MLRLSFIRENINRVIEGLEKRHFDDAKERINEILSLDKLRRTTQQDLDSSLAEQNKLSKEIGELYKSGQGKEAGRLKEQVGNLKSESAEHDERLKKILQDLEDSIIVLPNIPNNLVPKGKTEIENEVFQDWPKTLPDSENYPAPHWELGIKYNILDMALGAKISGSGFPLYRNKGARLQRALISFFLDEATDAGYEEILPPYLVNEDSAHGTGQLPDKEGQMYFAEKDNLYLIPTAEIPVTNIHRGDILDNNQLPVKLTGYTPCFRREAGSYGADVKGLNRVHQFDKVEIVRIEKPENSYNALEEMLNHVEGLLNKLKLPYRILRLCTGDLGFTSAITYDFEVFAAGQQKWLEVSSVSNFETFQSNRMKMRFRNDEGKPQLAHTLNGSALALARIFAAIIENNQTADSIIIPDVLLKYTGFDRIS